MSVKKVFSFLIILMSSMVIYTASAEDHGHADHEPAKEADDAVTLIAGHNYELVTPAQPTQSGDKVEVLEIFWYGCGHCYNFEPDLHTWIENKADDVSFRRMPGVFRQNWVPHAKAFYTAKKLGVLEQIHTPLFNAIHERQRKIFTDDAILDFVDGLDGVDGDAFRKSYNAFSVESKVKQAMRLSKAYGIRGVPAIIVNGKYWTSGSLVGSYPEL
ncbi:MAG: thiol:disulfide interchange protein DsbA/DsbL, partial [Gammaproteobacteria bacterium]